MRYFIECSRDCFTRARHGRRCVRYVACLRSEQIEHINGNSSNQPVARTLGTEIATTSRVFQLRDQSVVPSRKPCSPVLMVRILFRTHAHMLHTATGLRYGPETGAPSDRMELSLAKSQAPSARLPQGTARVCGWKTVVRLVIVFVPFSRSFTYFWPHGFARATAILLRADGTVLTTSLRCGTFTTYPACSSVDYFYFFTIARLSSGRSYVHVHA